MITVWIYVDTSKEVGDPDHLKVFETIEAAEAWFEDNDPEGVAFEYPFVDRPFSDKVGVRGAPQPIR